MARVCDFGTPELEQHGHLVKERVDASCEFCERFASQNAASSCFPASCRKHIGTVRVRNVSNVWPPERYYKRGTLSDDQYRAAQRFYRDFVRGNLSSHYGSTMFDPSKSFDSIYKELEMTELQADALLNFRKAWRSLNNRGADILWHVACNDMEISAYEKMMHWREGYGMIRLREALDDLGWFYRRGIKND